MTPLERGKQIWWALTLGVKGCVKVPPVDERGKGTQAEGTECDRTEGRKGPGMSGEGHYLGQESTVHRRRERRGWKSVWDQTAKNLEVVS